MIPLRLVISELRGIDAGRGSDERGVVFLRRRRGSDAAKHPLRAMLRLTNAALTDSPQVSGALRGNWSSLGPAGAIAAGCAVAASLFAPLGAATGRTAGVRHAVRWFVGLSIDEKVFRRLDLLEEPRPPAHPEIAQEFLSSLLGLPEVKALLSAEHFSVDGTMLKAWASMKSFRPKAASDESPGNGPGDPPKPRRNGEVDFRKTRRSNVTHASTTDKDARLFRKGAGQESRLAYLGHVLMENRNGLVAAAEATLATGTAEREARQLSASACPRGRPSRRQGLRRRGLRRGPEGARD